MQARIRIVAPALLIATGLACSGVSSVGLAGGGAGIGVGMSRDTHRKDVEDWYRGRIRRLTAEDGWLTLVGLFPIQSGTLRLGSAADNDLVFPATAPPHAGTLSVDSTRVVLEVAGEVQMTHDGAPVTRTELASDKDGDPTEIRMGSIRFYVIDRSGHRYLRVKDSESPVRKNFHGIDRFPVSEKWRVEARFDRYDPPKPINFQNVLGYEETVNCPGVLVFQIDGHEYRLEPTPEPDNPWFIMFGDATSGKDTYGGGRMLYAIPAADGKVVVDFNRAYNPPCVFTGFATCPLPRRENVLPIRVEAGEKMWGGAHP